MTEDQADFIAALPNVYCDMHYAITAHAFLQRVAEVDLESARNAVRIGVALGFVEIEPTGKVRLALALQQERDALQKSEGYAELAAGELAALLVQRASSASGT